MRVAFIGSREWVNREKIREVMERYKGIAAKRGDILTVVSGGAPGADRISEEIAKELGCNTLTFYANWSKWGKSAGPIRNTELLDEGFPEVIVAFKKSPISKGTDDTLEKARKRKIPIEVYTD